MRPLECKIHFLDQAIEIEVAAMLQESIGSADGKPP
jgi:hypothetical protein